MLDGLLGRSFSAKCKSSIKLIKTRIDAIRRRRNAMQKYLRKDIADLLKNGLDINAYGRAEGLLVELNLSSCYDLVEHFCGSVPRHLSVMQKQSACPEECREAVSSLMFAAARFADLPELRDLRELFTEKYGDTVGLFKNQEFVEKLALKPPTAESKLQLMRDIARESSIKWDSTAFEQKISNPVQDRPKRHGSLNDPLSKPYTSRDDSALKRETQDGLSRERKEQTKDGFKPHIGRDGTVPKINKEDGYKASYEAQETTLKLENEDILYRGRREPNDEVKLRNAAKVTIPKKDNQEVISRGRREHNINGYQPNNGVEEPVAKKDNLDVPSHGRREYIDDRLKRRDGRDENVPKRENRDASLRGKPDLNGENESIQRKDNWEILSRKRHELNEDGLRVRDARKDHARKAENLANSSHDRKGEPYILHGDRENASHGRDDQGISSHRIRGHAFVAHVGNDQTIHAEFKDKAFEEANTVKPHNNVIPPPPYVRPNAGKYGTRNSMTDQNSTTPDTPVFDRDVNARSERAHKEPTNERQEFGHGRVNGHRDENGQHREDDLLGERKPKPMSVRRRHLKPPPGHPEYNTDKREGEEVLKSNPSDRRRDSRRGLQHALYDDDDSTPKDEEEKMMDKLLMHYSKKPSKFEEAKVRAGLNSPPVYDDVPERKQKREGSRMNMDSARPPARAVSLPPEPVTPKESRRGPARASSFQPEVAAHVHPNLPDYQDLAARVASLRSR